MCYSWSGAVDNVSPGGVEFLYWSMEGANAYREQELTTSNSRRRGPLSRKRGLHHGAGEGLCTLAEPGVFDSI